MFEASSNTAKAHHGNHDHHRYKSLADVEKSAPHWKDLLRSDCIARARKKRREILMQKRRQAGVNTTYPNNISAMPMMIQPVRSLIEDELRKRGIRVVPVDPGLEENPTEKHDTVLQQFVGDGRECVQQVFRHQRGSGEKTVEMEVDTTTNDEYAITEEVLNSLLQDIEEEIRYDEQNFMEEALEAEENLIMDQVAEYEAWGDDMPEEASASAVLCPLCQNSYLQLQPENGITCRDGRCKLCIDVGHTGDPLGCLRRFLAMTYQEHALYCTNALSFGVSDRHGSQLLVARCQQCSLCNFFSG